MLSKSLQQILVSFIGSINEIAKVQAKQIAENKSQTIYTDAYKEEQETKIIAATAEAMQMVRDAAQNSIITMFDNARATVFNSVSEGAHDVVFEEIKNAVEATGGDFTGFEIDILIDKAAKHYFALKYLYRMTKDGTNAAAILNERFKMPDPDYYISLFDDEESYLTAFIKTYKNDTAAAIDLAKSDVKGETLVSGDHFEKLHERLEVNPLYLSDDDMSVPTLRYFERKILKDSGIVLDTNDNDSKMKVREAARKGGKLRNVMTRTVWKDIIDEETRKAWEEAQDDAQIKYGSIGRMTRTAMNGAH